MKTLSKRIICNRKFVALLITSQSIILCFFMLAIYQSNKRSQNNIRNDLITQLTMENQVDSSNNVNILTSDAADLSTTTTTAVINESTLCHPLTSVKQFSSKYIPILESLDLIEPTERFDESNITEHMPVFMSGCTDDHHVEEEFMLCESLQRYSGIEPAQKRFILFDLGGCFDTEEKLAELRENCPWSFVEYRTFNYSRYPAYVRNITQFRWKPLIIAESLLEFPAIWWVDSSTQFTNQSLKPVFAAINKPDRYVKFSIFSGSGHSIYATTNPGMYDYLPMNPECAMQTGMVDAGIALYYSTKTVRRLIVKKYVQCALEADCMGPTGAKGKCNWRKIDATHIEYNKLYSNCHRFDQSALNIIASMATNNNRRDYTMMYFPVYTKRWAPSQLKHRKKHNKTTLVTNVT